jgi:hypothetical protein
MDNQSSALLAPEMPARLPEKTALPPRPAAGDVQQACAIAQAVVAIALDQPGPSPQAAPTSRAAAFARQIAMYLAHVGFGIPMAAIGNAFGRDRTTVVHACHLIEDRRDEARFDDLLDHLEQAAIALRAARWINAQD